MCSLCGACATQVYVHRIASDAPVGGAGFAAAGGEQTFDDRVALTLQFVHPLPLQAIGSIVVGDGGVSQLAGFVWHA